MSFHIVTDSAGGMHVVGVTTSVKVNPQKQLGLEPRIYLSLDDRIVYSGIP